MAAAGPACRPDPWRETSLEADSLWAYRVAQSRVPENSPSPPFRGEREGPRRDSVGEGEVGDTAKLPHERPGTYLTFWTGYMSDRFLGSVFANFAP
jgi:hypothetical protein